MPKQTVASIDPAGRRVFIRVDFNVPIENGRITDDRRIRAALPTIRSVIDRGGRAVLASHLGRPDGTGYQAAESLRPVAERLSELLGRPVRFPSTDCADDATARAVADLKNGEVLLLENLRFHKGEKSGDRAFAERLASYADIYVNDAFGACHRADASMVALPTLMAGSPRVSGFLVEKEVRHLSEALSNPARPFTLILGGAKVSDKLPAIEHLMPRADNILVGGAMAYTFLKALGRDIGASRVEQDRLDDARRILDLAAASKTDLHLPTDHVCSTVFAEQGGDIEVFEGNIHDGFMGLDIGPKSRFKYSEIIRVSRTIVWNGPMGVFEWAPFKMGTKVVAESIAQATDAGATSVVGGGDSAAAAEMFGVTGRITHVSTGGGASLEMLEGRAFESVELLDDA